MKIKRRSGFLPPDSGGAMTDISFLLIIFFLVTAVFVADQGLKLKLPDKNSEPEKLHSADVIQVAINSNGEYRLNGNPLSIVDGLKNLEKETEKLIKQNPDSVVLITAGEMVIYQQVLDVLTTLKNGGAGRFSIISLTNDPLPVSLKDIKI